MATNNEKMYLVKNRSASMVVYKIPEDGIRREFAPGESKKIKYAELEKPFFEFATAKGMVGIKGHRSVGGFRASCYNAQSIEGVEALVACMKEFEAMH